MENSYTLLDCGNFRKLEQVGPYRFVRPSPQAVWEPSLDPSKWKDIDAEFIRKSDGKGFWKTFNDDLPDDWSIELEGITLRMSRTNFGHLGLFVEQKDNWSEFIDIISKRAKPNSEYRVLNLFAYTGGASVACAKAGAQVTHVDASKTSNQWAGANTEINNLQGNVRWITEDVKAFVAREIRRGNKYEGIILDPPSFGRGVKGQVWKIEEDMTPLLSNLKQLFSDNFHFISLSSHSQGYTPIALKNLLMNLCNDLPGEYSEREMIVNFKDKSLPAGATCLFQKN